MNTAVIYARVSTVAQEDNYSIQTQLEACRKYAGERDFNVVAEYTDTESGATLHRLALGKLRDLLRQGAVDAVVIYCVDRLSRDAAGYYLIKEELKRQDGIALRYKG